MDYYCHKCTLAQGSLSVLAPLANLTGTQYQFDKFQKHMSGASIRPTGEHSVFNFDDYGKYKDFYVQANLSGISQLDDQNRTNIIMVFSGAQIGSYYSGGSYIANADAVKIALNLDTKHAHVIPIPNGTSIYSCKCSTCGGDLTS